MPINKCKMSDTTCNTNALCLCFVQIVGDLPVEECQVSDLVATPTTCSLAADSALHCSSPEVVANCSASASSDAASTYWSVITPVAESPVQGAVAEPILSNRVLIDSYVVKDLVNKTTTTVIESSCGGEKSPTEQ